MEIVKLVLPYIAQLLMAGLGAFFAVYIAKRQDSFRFDLKRKEIYQQHIAIKKVELCNRLLSDMLLFHSEAAPIQYGVDPLRFRKDKRVTGEVSEEDKKHTLRLFKIIRRMQRLVAFNQLYLGTQVVAAWHREMSTFNSLQIFIQLNTMPDLMIEIDAQLTKAYDGVLQAVRHELKDAGIDLIAPSTVTAIRKKGQEEAHEIIAKARKEQTS